MDQPEDSTSPEPRADTSAGEAALQLVELVALALIDRGIIERDELVGHLESLAADTPHIAPRSTFKTVRGRLSDLATSFAAYRTESSK